MLVHLVGLIMTSHRESNEKFKVEIIVYTRANSLLAKNRDRIFTGICISRMIFAVSRGKLKSSIR